MKSYEIPSLATLANGMCLHFSLLTTASKPLCKSVGSKYDNMLICMGPWAICGEALVHAEVQCRCVANDGEQRVEMSIRATIDTMSKEAMGLYKPNNILHTVAVVLVHCGHTVSCAVCRVLIICW